MRLITRYEEIVDKNSIGKSLNPVSLSALLTKAEKEAIPAAQTDNENVLLLIIDMQKDFMETGALPVQGSLQDVYYLTRFIYDNASRISKIAISLDTHNPFQIFHPCWWQDKDGNNPLPFTTITADDCENGKWIPVLEPELSRDYVYHLGKLGKKTLVIWPYHCLQGTEGASLENQLANMIYFHSVTRKTTVDSLVKGSDPLTEMYGILKPEYDPKGYVNVDFLMKMEQYHKIIIAGEAKSHCVMESVKQILDHYSTRKDITSRIYILEDCMSSIEGFEESTENAFLQFKEKHVINIIKSTELKL